MGESSLNFVKEPKRIGRLQSDFDLFVFRKTLAAWTALLSLTTLLATLPHLILKIRTGCATYIPDWDGILYLAWSRGMVLEGRQRLVDAIHPASGPMMHPWVLFGPPALLARGLGLDMVGLSILWRIAAATLLTGSLHFALRPFIQKNRLLWGTTLFLLFDPGFLTGQPCQAGWSALLSILRQHQQLFSKNASIFSHLRVVTPGLALPFLLIHYGLVWRARVSTRPLWTVLAGFSLGCLFYSYFYFWTATLVGTGLAWILDAKGRRIHAQIMLLGILVGLPALFENYRIKNSTAGDWLIRTEKFAPTDRFQNILIFKGLIFKYILVGIWIFRSRRELIQAWCAGAGSIAFMNHQILTKLNIENFHWSQPAGITWSLLATIFVLERIEAGASREESKEPNPRRRRFSARSSLLLTVALALQIPLGFYLRVEETLRTKETRLLEESILRYRRDAPTFDIPAGAVVGGDGRYFMIGAALSTVYPLSGRLVDFCSKTDDREMEERLMLNAFLFGFSRREAWAVAEKPREAFARTWWIAYEPRGALVAKRRGIRESLVDSIWDDPKPWLDKYRVDYVVLPIGGGDPLRFLPTPGIGAPRSPASRIGAFAERSAVGETWECWRIIRGNRRQTRPARANRP